MANSDEYRLLDRCLLLLGQLTQWVRGRIQFGYPSEKRAFERGRQRMQQNRYFDLT